MLTSDFCIKRKDTKISTKNALFSKPSVPPMVSHHLIIALRSFWKYTRDGITVKRFLTNT